jgi:hypothetical protein
MALRKIVTVLMVAAWLVVTLATSGPAWAESGCHRGNGGGSGGTTNVESSRR